LSERVDLRTLHTFDPDFLDNRINVRMGFECNKSTADEGYYEPEVRH